MLVPKPLTGDRIQNTNDAGRLASASLDGIDQLRDESLGVGQSSCSFLQLMRDAQAAGPAKKGPGAGSVFDNIGSPFKELKQSAPEDFSQNGLTDKFANLSVRRVGRHRSRLEGEDKGSLADKTTATVYGDGSLNVRLTDGNTVNADANSGQISLASDTGIFSSDGAGNYYFTDETGNQRLIDQAVAQEYGAELKDGSLAVGQYRFEGGRLTLADGSNISVSHGRVHAHFKGGDGLKGDVDLAATSGQSVVTSDAGAQSLVSGDDAFITDSQGGMRYGKLTGNALDKTEPLGGVPIREAMMTLFALADDVRGKSVISFEQYSALQAAVAQLNGASVACKDLHNWAELRFIHTVSSNVDRFLAHVTPGGNQNGNQPLRNTELAEAIAEPVNRGENRNLSGSPTYLPLVRFDPWGGVVAERSNQLAVPKTRSDNPGMVSDAAISEASKVLPVEKA
jgi:hypothetical protein